MIPRDPRIDPQFGDSVTSHDETREVEKRIGDRVIYSWPGKLAVRTLQLSAWQAWAAQASEWHAADAESAAA
jgi:hypothetical protein